MAEPLRELALSAFFEALPGEPAFVRKLRNATWTLDAASMPALVQYDGGDEVFGDSQGINHIEIRVQVVVGVKTETDEELGPAMSEARGQILLAFKGDPTLGDLVRWVKYESSDDPVFLTESGSPPAAAWVLHFVIEMHETEHDPYLLV